jgi:prepilin signal peptidase PulO-like enzyme (type II secretory pathway)
MTVPSFSVQEPPASEPTAAAERPPLSELLPTGGLRAAVAGAMVAAVIASFAHFGLTGHALLGAVFTPTLVLLAAIDARHRLLPNMIILAATLAVGLILAATAAGSFFGHLAVGAVAGAFFFVCGTLFPGSIGMGDAKLVFLVGLALGSKALGAAVIAFAALLVVALYVVFKRGAAARGETIPFGPFVALGGLVVFFLG